MLYIHERTSHLDYIDTRQNLTNSLEEIHLLRFIKPWKGE